MVVDPEARAFFGLGMRKFDALGLNLGLLRTQKVKICGAEFEPWPTSDSESVNLWTLSPNLNLLQTQNA